MDNIINIPESLENAVVNESFIDVPNTLSSGVSTLAACKSICERVCTGGCQDSCQQGCMSACTASCTSACTASCTSGCQVSCQSTCESACTAECNKICQSNCEASCQTTCLAACEGNCTSTCQTGQGPTTYTVNIYVTELVPSFTVNDTVYTSNSSITVNNGDTITVKNPVVADGYEWANWVIKNLETSAYTRRTPQYITYTVSSDINLTAEATKMAGAGTYIYTNGEWKRATPYVYSGGAWKEAAPYIYSGGWKP